MEYEWRPEFDVVGGSVSRQTETRGMSAKRAIHILQSTGLKKRYQVQIYLLALANGSLEIHCRCFDRCPSPHSAMYAGILSEVNEKTKNLVADPHIQLVKHWMN